MRSGCLRMLALSLGVLACQTVGGVPREEMPERPIVLRWYDREEFRRRAQDLEDMQSGGHRQTREGVADAADVVSFVNRVLGVGQGKEGESLEKRYPGRMAFYDARSDEIDVVEQARPGAIPRAWSRDGEKLLFTQLSGRLRQLFEYRPATGEVRPVTRGPAVHADGCYGPEGRFVVLAARAGEHGPTSYVELLGRGGTRERLSEGPRDWSPTCAPDGSAVAWVNVDERGHDTLMTRMPPVGGELRRLGPGRDPSFSHDSQWLVYSVPSGRFANLFRIRPDGSGRHAIGRTTVDALQGSFSPDDRLVTYVADDGYRRRLYLRRFDGSGDRVLLEEGGGTDPVW